MRTNLFYQSPMSGFLLCNLDEDGDPQYYGYENIYGAWIIMKAVESGETTYAYDTGGYSAAWSNKATQTYALPSVSFASLLI